MEIFEFLKSLPIENRITVVGVFVTAILSLITVLNTFRNNEKNAYLSSITKERVDSLGNLKESTALFFSKLIELKQENFNKDIINETIGELEYLKLKIFFQLNSNNFIEKQIITEINDYLHYIYRCQDYQLNKLDDTDIEKLFKIEDNQRFILNDSKQIHALFRSKFTVYDEKLRKDLTVHIQKEWNKIKKETTSFLWFK